jgi:hypothetical protein
MQTLALIWGILAMLGMLVAFLPCLGSLNWLNIPFSMVGVIISIVSISNAPIGSRGAGNAGLALNAVATILGALRLALGGGIL